jgi:hypothetical protein
MGITAQGMRQPDIDVFLRAVDDLADELKADRALSFSSYLELCNKLDSDATVGDTDYFDTLADGGATGWPANPTAAALDDSVFTDIDMSQEDMVTFIAAAELLINELRTDRTTQATSFAAFMAKLDLDSGVTDTDYAAVLDVGGTGAAWPANPASAAIDDALLSAQGVSQPDLYAVLAATQALANELRTDRTTQSASYAALLAKLDADGLTDTDYAAVLGIGGTGDAWPANPASAALDLTA